ncbi:hypothetical protein D3C86_1006590 [compost metagenome]
MRAAVRASSAPTWPMALALWLVSALISPRVRLAPLSRKASPICPSCLPALEVALPTAEPLMASPIRASREALAASAALPAALAASAALLAALAASAALLAVLAASAALPAALAASAALPATLAASPALATTLALPAALAASPTLAAAETPLAAALASPAPIRKEPTSTSRRPGTSPYLPSWMLC